MENLGGGRNRLEFIESQVLIGAAIHEDMTIRDWRLFRRCFSELEMSNKRLFGAASLSIKKYCRCELNGKTL
jgi:hypothetical protein